MSRTLNKLLDEGDALPAGGPSTPAKGPAPSPAASPADSPPQPPGKKAVDADGLTMYGQSLAHKSMAELIEIAEKAGIHDVQVEAAMETEDPKAALIRLIDKPEEAAAAMAIEIPSGPLRQAGYRRHRGTRIDGWGKAAMCKAAANVDNDPDAQYWLGRRFLEGRTVAEDKAEGARWLRKAAAQGHYLAQCQLGKLTSQTCVKRGDTATHYKYTAWKE